MYDVSKYTAAAWAHLGERIRMRRTAKGWTQEDLADEAGVSTNTIGNLESGKRGRLLTLPKIARALDWSEDSCMFVLEGREPVIEVRESDDDTLRIPRPADVTDIEWAAITEKMQSDLEFWLRTRRP